MEFADTEERRVSQMLSELKRVEAPKDFDFHLKARIANARPADVQTASLFPILKYAAPLALFLLAGAGVLFFGSLGGNVRQAAVSTPETPLSTSAPVITEAPAVQNSIDIASNRQTRQDSAPVPPSNTRIDTEDRRVVRTTETPRTGGFRDFTSSPSPRFPRNSADKAVRVSDPALTPKDMSTAPIDMREVFRRLDVEADFENNSWKVRSVKPNGVADQIGVKTGDSLKEIDGTPVGENTRFNAVFNVGKIRVQRGEATVDLSRTTKPE